MYQEPYKAHLTDQIDPFAIASTVRPAGWRPAIGLLMGAFSVDVLEEQRRAWDALNRARADKGFPPETLAEMERAFYVLPEQTMPDQTKLRLTPATFRKIREAWRGRGALTQAGIDYTTFFKRNYERVVELEAGGRRQAAGASSR